MNQPVIQKENISGRMGSEIDGKKFKVRSKVQAKGREVRREKMR